MHSINESLKQSILAILKEKPIQKAAVFGSFARGEERSDSDIDLLIEYSKPQSIFDLLKLENELSKATSRRIDIVEYAALKSTIREKVLHQAIEIL